MFKSLITNIVSKHLKRKIEKWTIKEEDLTELLEQIKISLLDGDVNIKVVNSFIKTIHDKCLGITIEPNQDPQNVVLTIIKEELTKILGNNTTTINTDKSLVKIMMIGLQGSGKTTTCAKIANYYKKKFNKKPLLVGIDIYRPAAIEQLRTLAKENGIDFFEKGTQNPVITADEALTFAKTNGNNIIIFDTAGRLQTDEVMMEELKNVRNKISPDEILLVIDAMSGQEIVNVASEFNNTLHISGLVITKLDGDTRAGAALSLVSILKKPIKFTGVGEKIGSLELFHPSRMASRILGLGDILTLAEKSKDLMDENVVKKSFARMLAGKMDLEDLMVQMSQLGKMGPLSSISKMMPGANNISETQIAEAQEKMRIWNILLSSMTLKERRNPIFFKKEPGRKTRVVKGSGRKPDELNKLLNEWEKSKEKMDVLARNIRSGKNPFMGMNNPFGK